MGKKHFRFVGVNSLARVLAETVKRVDNGVTVMNISSGKECKIISKEDVENLGPSFAYRDKGTIGEYELHG